MQVFQINIMERSDGTLPSKSHCKTLAGIKIILASKSKRTKGPPETIKTKQQFKGSITQYAQVKIRLKNVFLAIIHQ